MKHFLLFYDVAPDYIARRPEFRDAHLARAWAAQARNELILAGALSDPLDGAMLVFRGETRQVAEEFAKTDPYVLNGLVVRWRIREWLTVVGEDAVSPVRPGAVGDGLQAASAAAAGQKGR